MTRQDMIRSATAREEPLIRELVFAILKSYGLEPSPKDTDADLFDLNGFYFDRGGDFSVLLDGEEIIGTVALFNLGNEVCELRKMYLDPNFRRRGLGKQLLEYGLVKARELGFTQVTLETASELKEAVALYKSYGFEPFEPDHLAPRCDIAMRLDL
ncbi:GNAT family N-acetyltransferase [Verrucomicrobiales bacterium]|jgi:putative acetyltransferase|nr:GNAT family N-acetyltransferase [Verrucomicrobiales bacterium]MDA9924589.1 GNAT family N-acetyltransferase [Verrucomicrobiales bacterium]